MRLAASVVTYHTSPEELKKCLGTLSDSCAEAIYVVDHSGNNDLESTVLLYPKTHYISQPNRGYGAGHNVALRQSIARDFDLHLVINSDVEIAPADIDRMAQYMADNTSVGAIHPKILNRDGTPQHTVRMLPSPIDVIARRFLPKFLFKKRRERYELRHIDPSRQANIPYMQGSFMMMSCAVLKEVGLFDDRFFLYPEDIDMSRRLHRVAPTLYYPEVTAIHHHRSASYHSFKMLCIHIANMIRYFNKWGWFFDAERKRFNAPFMK